MTRKLFLLTGLIILSPFVFAVSDPTSCDDDSAKLNPQPAFATMVNPNPPVRLMADPNINLNRVPPPRKFLLRAPKTSTITINFLPAGSPDAQWGDVTIAWPNDAKNALLYAAGIWETLLNSSVPIVIDAGWVNNLGTGVLGHSGAKDFLRDFSGAPVAGTWYPATLANALAGTDQKPANADIYMGFSSTFSWYTGTDGNTPNSDYDLISVVLHEICHGLGFAGSMKVSGGSGSWGLGTVYPIAYDRFTEDGSGTMLLNTTTYPNPSAALASALTSGNLYFDGTDANAANGGSRVPIYAPGTWNGGSSYSHLAESYNGTPHALMTYSLGFGESEHSPGDITVGLLQDVGWPTGGGGGDIQPFDMAKFKCIINWKQYTTSSKGNLMVLGSMPSTVSDLGFLNNSFIDNIVKITGGGGSVTGDGSDFFSINGKKTTVTYKFKSETSKFRRLAKLKLKKGRLYLLYKTKYGSNYAEKLGVTSTGTPDWTPTNMQFDFDSSYGGTIVSGRWSGTVMYKTKEGKKSVIQK